MFFLEDVMRHASNEVLKGKNLDVNLSKLGTGLMNIFNNYSFIRLSMNYYTYYEMVSEKTGNDKVLKNLDTIYLALSTNSQITFQYMRWNPQKKLEFLREGKLFAASPFAVSLNDDNYYLISFDSRTGNLRHYRIDKMKNIQLTFEPREGKDIFKSFDIVDYTQKTFGMFGGNEETVSLEVPNHLAGVFIDRFGEAANIRKNFENPDTFLVRISVNISPQFFAWVFGLGKEVKIISPESVKNEFAATAKEILSNYQS